MTEDIYDLGRRSYWSRIWIVQEILLGRKVFLHCGLDIAEWRAFYFVLKYHKFTHDDNNNGQQTFDNAQWVVGEERIPRSPPPAQEILGLKEHALAEGSSFELLRLLIACRASECSIRHDRIYGLLGLASDVPQGSIPIDYASSLTKLRVCVTSWYITKHRTSRGSFVPGASSASTSVTDVRRLLDEIFAI